MQKKQSKISGYLFPVPWHDVDHPTIQVLLFGCDTLLDILKNREARTEKRDRFRLKNNEIPSFENEIHLASLLPILIK